jgi:hypothetical protein
VRQIRNAIAHPKLEFGASKVGYMRQRRNAIARPKFQFGASGLIFTIKSTIPNDAKEKITSFCFFNFH